MTKKLSTISILPGANLGVVQEDGTLLATGQLLASDSDPAATLTWSVANAGLGTYGALTLMPDGSWSYSLLNNDAKVQALAAGQTAIESFAIKVVDSHGSTATQIVKIAVTGTEDVPTITFAPGGDHGALQEDVVTEAGGRLLGHDVDAGSVLAWKVLGGGVGQYGKLAVSHDGEWTYALANASAAVQSLAEGEHVGESFTLQVDDGQGGVATQVVTLDIMGRNDAPVIAASASVLTGAVQEDVTLTTQGLVAAGDKDHGSSLTYDVVGGGKGAYGTLSIDQAGHWSYALDNASAKVQALKGGQTEAESFKIKVTDEHGAVASKVVSVTVAGTDEGAVVPPVAVADAATTSENAPVTLDVLGNDTGTGLVLTGGTLPAGSGSFSVVNNQLVFNPGTAFDHLAQGATATVTGAYTLHDAADATATAPVTVTVTGTNDAPIVASALSLAATEDAASVTLDLLSGASDADDGAVMSVANVTGLGAGLSLLGSTLTVDATDAGFQALALGETQVLTVGYDVVDEFGASVAQTATVTVTGTNDAPIVAAALSLGVAEDAAPVMLDLLAGASDVDHGAVLSVANVTGLGAGLSLLGSTLTVDPTDAGFQALAQGETRVLTVGYDVVDEFGAAVAQTATVIVTGTNDAPVVAAALSATALQGSAPFTIDLLAGATDPDATDMLHVAGVTGLGAGMTLNGDVLTIDPTSAAYSALTAGSDALTQISYDIVDGQGGVVAQTAAIDILGTAVSAAAIAGDVAGALVEAATQPDGTILPGTSQASGVLQVVGGDPSVSWNWTGTGFGTYGDITVNPATGAWTYTLDNAVTDSLAAGEVVTEALSLFATDSFGNVLEQVVDLTVTGANDAPVAQVDYASGGNMAPTVIDPLFDGSAYDPDAGDVLSLTGASVTAGFGGSVSIVAGQLVYDPGADYTSLLAGDFVDVIIDYTVTDSGGLSSTGQVDVQLAGQDLTYPPGVKVGAFTVIDAAQATAQGDAIAAAVLGAAPQGLSFNAGSLSLTAGAASAAYYDGSLTGLGIGPGLLITSGTVPGTSNTSTYFGQDNAMAGNAALDAVVNSVFNTQTFDATMLSFDFTVTDPTVTSITFKAVFGTDEFPEWVDAFVDIAVVLVNGQNVALFNNDPGAPLSVIGSNLAANYFIDNTGNLDPLTGQAKPGIPSLLPTEYDGVSHVLNIAAPVHAGVNTITIGIADTGDHVYDSGLFISSLVSSTQPATGGVSLQLTGTGGADVLTGTVASETIDAGGGNDIIDAGGGNDTVLAGAGDDVVTGGAGNDLIDGGTGLNTAVFSGASTDYYVLQLANGDYSVEDLRNFAPDGLDHLINIQELAFLDGTYAITSFLPVTPPPATGVAIEGTAGDDIISALQTVPGQPLVTDAGDTIHGKDGDDIITGGAGNDLIFGDGGNDQLRGGAGLDTLVGGAGHDEMTGGSGADVFRFDALSDSPVAGMDQITDFSHADADIIDLHLIGGLHFVTGATAFSGSMGELISVKGLDGYTLQADFDGDLQADFAVLVTAATKLIATDFVL